MELFWEIAIPVLLLLGGGLAVGLLLTLSARAFAVKQDPKAEKIRDILPGANCGACGFAGCDEYAEKAAAGEAPVGLCVPGGDQVSASMSEILGVEGVEVLRKKAHLNCHVCSSPAVQKFEYNGVPSCRAAANFYGGDRACRFGCLGYGDCAAACDFHAITMNGGMPEIDRELCTGCGKCVKTCPKKCLSLLPETQKFAVACSNREVGKKVMSVCRSGCIGCGKCVKNCPANAIELVDHLASIVPENCIGCGTCAENCPTHCIEELL